MHIYMYKYQSKKCMMLILWMFTISVIEIVSTIWCSLMLMSWILEILLILFKISILLNIKNITDPFQTQIPVSDLWGLLHCLSFCIVTILEVIYIKDVFFYLLFAVGLNIWSCWLLCNFIWSAPPKRRNWPWRQGDHIERENSYREREFQNAWVQRF